MGSFLGALFGGGSTTEKIVDGVINGTDALFFTDEEKSQANQKVLDFKIEWLKNTQGQNIARRILALMVGAMWMLVGLLVLFAYAIEYTDFAKFAANYMKDVVMPPFSLIVAFYYLDLKRAFNSGGKK